jgi:hypothetical protein
MKERNNLTHKQHYAPREGHRTAAVEHVTASLPSMTWLWLAGASMLLSAGLAFTRERKGGSEFRRTLGPVLSPTRNLQQACQTAWLGSGRGGLLV